MICSIHFIFGEIRGDPGILIPWYLKRQAGLISMARPTPPVGAGVWAGRKEGSEIPGQRPRIL